MSVSVKTEMPQPQDAADLKKRSQWKDIWKRLRRHKLAMIGMVMVIILVLCAIFADFVAPYGYDQISPSEAMEYPSLTHPLGTDNYGRDMLTRIIYGGRISLLVAVCSIAISLALGGFLGMTAGFLGGTYDGFIMRVMDIMLAIPGLLLAICISTALGTGVWNTVLALGISFTPSSARMMRALVMSLRNQEYVEAAQVSGASKMRTMLRHIVPNALSPIIVDSTLRIGAAIMMISSLSFIGLGVQPPTPEWGSMLSAGRQYIRDFWPMVVFPGLAIMFTLFGFNLFGDGLRDALDPKLKR